MIAFQDKLTGFNRPLSPAAVPVHVCKREQFMLLQCGFDRLKTGLDMPAAHPWGQVDPDLTGFQLNGSGLLRRNDAPDLCQGVYQFVTPDHA